MLDLLKIVVTAFLLGAVAVSAKLPARNMTVELRIISQSEAENPQINTSSAANGFVVRSQPSQEHDLEIQKIYVMNGERAQVKLGRSMPLQWVKSAAARASSKAAVSGETSSNEAQAVENSLHESDQGQSLAVLVRWSGGKQAAVVEVDMNSASVESPTGRTLPDQLRSRVATTIVTPLGEWATIAVSGPRAAPEQAGVYSTREPQSQAAKLVQIRVLAP